MVQPLQCGQCKQFAEHFPRKYRGKRYCASCYSYFFISKTCSHCGEKKRIHRDDKKSLCRSCISKITPCFRCHRIGRPVGQINQYGLLCHSCANAFTPDGCCSICQRIGRVSIGKKLGINEPICDACRYRLNPKCSKCGTTRDLIKDKTEKLICTRCFHQNFLICRDCRGPIIGKNTILCTDCQTKRLHLKRKALNCARFSCPRTEQLFSDFVDWLALEVGYLKSAMKQNAFAELFVQLQSAPSDWLLQPYWLVKIDGGLLRKDSLPRRYLESVGMHFNERALNDAMEIRTIHQNRDAISRLCDQSMKLVISSYFDTRLSNYNRGRLKLITIRLETTALKGWLELAQTHHGLENGLKTFCIQTPGHKSALSHVMKHLNQNLGREFKLYDARPDERLAYIVGEYRERNLSINVLEEYLKLCLQVLHGVPSHQCAINSYQTVDDGYRVENSSYNFWVPRID